MGVARDAAVGTDPGQAPLNTLRHAQALPPVGAANPAQPSLDTLDSTGWLDVAAEPVIVSLPIRVAAMSTPACSICGRTSSGPPADQFGTRAAGLKTQTIAFASPGWKGDLPKGAKRVDVPTRNAWISVRIRVERHARPDGGAQAATRDPHRAVERL